MQTVIKMIMLMTIFSMVGCAGGFKHFVKVEDAKLVEDKKEVKFISYNIPNLHYVEDNFAFAEMNPWRLPNEFEIRDALTAISQMGANVVRIYTLSVKKKDDPPEIPRHILGPGEFNEEAFQVLDKVMEIANETGVRVIIPLVDNWHWWGGIAEYADFRGKGKGAFWSDPQIKADFKQTISFLLNRKNAYTGKLYKDDKAILAWETGNELESTPEWVAEIAAYIKSIDPNHLVIDGYHSTKIRKESVEDANIDLLTTHHYTSPEDMVKDIRKSAGIARDGKKPYFVGEFGFIPLDGVKKVLDTVIEEDISGALIWSLRFRNRDGGFYWHIENDKYASYHWPGFESGNFQDEKSLMELMRWKNAELNQREPQKVPKPPAPKMLKINDPSAISWQGSAGAEYYSVERSENSGGPYTTIGVNISDASKAYKPLFSDFSAEPGKTYYYRIIAKNSSGNSKPSQTSGPVTAVYRFIIDEFENLERVSAVDGDLELQTAPTNKTKADLHRLKGASGSSITYDVGQQVRSLKIFAYFPKNIADFEVEGGRPDGRFEKISMERIPYYKDREHYSDYRPLLFQTSDVPAGITKIKITYKTTVEIGRLELFYLNDE